MPMVEVSNGGTAKEYIATSISTPFNIVLEEGDLVCTKPQASNADVLINGVASRGGQSIAGLICLSSTVSYGNSVWQCTTAGTYAITAIRYEVGSIIVHPVQS